MTDTVVPRLFRGMQDYLPEQMAARQWLIDTIRDVYELYGFVPLATPAIEYLDVLSGSGGTEIQESIFTVKNPDIRLSQTDAPLGLRFDLTVPLARVVAQYRELSRPFRRYQVSPVVSHAPMERFGQFRIVAEHLRVIKLPAPSLPRQWGEFSEPVGAQVLNLILDALSLHLNADAPANQRGGKSPNRRDNLWAPGRKLARLKVFPNGNETKHVPHSAAMPGI